MKRFAFRLERIVQLRVSKERAQAARVADAKAVEAERRHIAQEALARVEDAHRQAAAHRGVEPTAGALANLWFALDQARLRAAAAEAEHQEAVDRLEQELQVFQEARRDRRTLERLKEERQRAWEEEARRVEQREVDEVALRIARPGESTR